MDKSELAQLMLEYEKLNKQLEDLGFIIRSEVMKLKESYTVGNVTASFSGGKRTFDYATAGKAQVQEFIDRGTFTNYEIAYDAIIAEANVPQELIDKHTTAIKTTDWKLVCDAAKIKKDDLPVLSQTNPSVTIKIKD